MNESLLKKYARLIVKSGINIQKDQILVVSSPIECAEFTRMITEIAYEEGAKEVVVRWLDELLSRIKYLKAPDEAFNEFPEWEKEFFLSYAAKGAAFLSISASDPEVMKGVNPERIAKWGKISGDALRGYMDRLMSNKNVWCVASIPTKSWAKKVFPELSVDEAVEKLWENIFKTVRADMEDPVAAWDEHKKNLKKSMDFLNSSKFKFLHYKNSLGTDLRIELPEGHIWLGGSDFTPEGIEFIANMPTEEVFTLPKRTGVNGIVWSSMPINRNGNIINKFSLTFKDGKIVDFSAEEGYDVLKTLVDTDEGSKYLGEVALVPYDSPISRLGILFYNTLFDENASCHLAIGEAYPVCIRNGENMSKEELEKAGVNNSVLHQDFMIGTKDLEITGITDSGEEIPVFRNGNFAF